MFHFLGFLFIIIIAILLIGLSIIGTVIRSIFGLGSRRSSNTYRNDNGNYQSGRGYSFNGRQQSGSSSNEEPKTRIKEETAHGRHKKLFSQDGWYLVRKMRNGDTSVMHQRLCILKLR